MHDRTQHAARPAPGFPDYLITRSGRVFSLISGDWVDPWTHESGHRYVALVGADGGKRKMQVHRLVLLAHATPPDGVGECGHRNGDPADNRLDNLRWISRAENIEDYRKLNGKHWRAKITLDTARAIRAESTGAVGEQRALAAKYGVGRDCVCDILNGRTYREVVHAVPGV